MSWSDRQARERVARLEELLATLEQLPEPARAQALDAVASLVEVYGEAFSRMVCRLPGDSVRSLGEDELVGHLLMVHELHPTSIEERVLAALEQVRPSLASHSGGVQLLGIDDRTVRLQLEGACEGCPSSTATLRLAVEEAILGAAPEIERVEADGVVADEPTAGMALPMSTQPSAADGGGAMPEARSPGMALPIFKQPPGPCPASSTAQARP